MQLTTQLTPWFNDHGQGKYRVGQVRQWLFQQRARDFSEMTDLSQALRDELARDFTLWSATIAKHTQADDGTEKLLLTLADGGQIECVLLRDETRRTICISTQVGCGMGCVFCASGLDGLTRNLTTGEIVEQMLRLQSLLREDERLSHIVVMGMGEPLANLDALLPALDEASREDGLGISARRITISTVGLTKAMRRLAETTPRYRLAVSLHAPNDELRQKIVPVADKIRIADVLAEADHYFDLSGRQLTFEYVLLGRPQRQPARSNRACQPARRPHRDTQRHSLQSSRRPALQNAEPQCPTRVPPNPGAGRRQRSLPPSQRRRDRRRLRAVAPPLADGGGACRNRNKSGRGGEWERGRLVIQAPISHLPPLSLVTATAS